MYMILFVNILVGTGGTKEGRAEWQVLVPAEIDPTHEEHFALVPPR